MQSTTNSREHSESRLSRNNGKPRPINDARPTWDDAADLQALQ